MESQERDLGIQNDFFNAARKNRTRVVILLNSGKRLAGRIRAFDRYTLILDAGGGGEEMVFKHAIATISVGAPRAGQGETGPGLPRTPRAETSPVAGASSGAGPPSRDQEMRPPPPAAPRLPRD